MKLNVPSTVGAVNDAHFVLPRVRNAPIKSSMTCIEGLPKKLKIYRISGSKYWQLRFFQQGRYTTQSLKTTDFEEAQTLARVFFKDLEASGAYVPSTTKSADLTNLQNQQLLHDVIEEVLATELEKVQRDEIKHGTYVMSKLRLEGLVFDFFQATHAQQNRH